MAIVFEHVVKTYRGEARAIDDLSLEVADGELLVLVGPSGCGKTTALRLVAGLERPTGGSIRLDGRPARGVAPQDRDVAMVFQGDTLYPHLSVRGNLAFPLKMRGTAAGEIRSCVEEAAALLEIDDLLDRRPWELSGGQRRRVALGRAIVRRPKVFLLDEPLSGLDAALRAQIRRDIRTLHDRLHATMIYVTHDQAEAMTLGDRIAVLHNGRLQQLSDPKTLYRRPANRFVAGLVGSPPMNFLSGRLAADQGQWTFRGDGVLIDVPNAYRGMLESYRDRPIVLGIRPEHLHRVDAATTNDCGTIRATVESWEFLAAECHVAVRLGGQSLIVRADSADGWRPGEQIAPRADEEQFRFFDPLSQQAIAAG